MESQYRFVGTSADILDTKYSFRVFGQLVSIDDELAKTCRFLIPASKFDSVGVSPEELKKYADVKSHSRAPADFIAKRNALWAMIDQGENEAPQEEVLVPAIEHFKQEVTE